MITEELNLSAADKFERSLVEDKTPLAPATDPSFLFSAGNLDPEGRYIILPYYRDPNKYRIDTAPQYGEVTEIQLQPWRGSLKNRLAAQTDDIRKRLSNPAAIVLAIRGTNYSAENIDDVLKLYFTDHPRRRILNAWTNFWGRVKNKLRFRRSKTVTY